TINRMDLEQRPPGRVLSLPWKARTVTRIEEELPSESELPRPSEAVQVLRRPYVRTKVRTHLRRQAGTGILTAGLLGEHDVDVIVLLPWRATVNALPFAHVRVVCIDDVCC